MCSYSWWYLLVIPLGRITAFCNKPIAMHYQGCFSHIRDCSDFRKYTPHYSYLKRVVSKLWKTGSLISKFPDPCEPCQVSEDIGSFLQLSLLLFLESCPLLALLSFSLAQKQLLISDQQQWNPGTDQRYVHPTITGYVLGFCWAPLVVKMHLEYHYC